MNTDDKTFLKQAVQKGVIGGIVLVFIAMIGMIQAFQSRFIVGGTLSMSTVLIFLTLFVSPYGVVMDAGHNKKRAFIGGIVSGSVSGLMMGLVIVAIASFNLREIFINASPELLEFMSFGTSPFVGAIILVLSGAAMGLFAALLTLLPEHLRNAILMTLLITILVGLVAELLENIIVQWVKWGAPEAIFDWLFDGRGLSIAGAIFVTVISFGAFMGSHFLGQKVSPNKKKQPVTGKAKWTPMLITLAILLSLPILLGVYMSEVMDQVGLFILMGLGLNIVVGFAGLLDLGYVAFYALGAYTIGVLTSPEIATNPMSYWAALPIAVLVATLAGVILGIPVLRMRGDYLAIVTLGFGEIIRIMAGSDLLKPWIGGSQGIQAIAKPTIGGFVFDNQQDLFYIILAGAILAGIIATRLRDSRLGRSWMAMREDEDVAEAMGMNLVVTKLLAFGTGAAFSGLSGAIFAAKVGSAYPQSFNFIVSINVLALIIVGGLGSIPGVIVGSLVLVGLPELLREFGEYRMLVYGALLVFMMLKRPEGFLPAEVTRRELHAEEEEPNEELEAAA